MGLHTAEERLEVPSRKARVRKLVDGAPTTAGDFDDLNERSSTTLFSDRDYFHGWSEGEDVALLYVDELGNRKKEVVPFEWYFFIRDSQKQTIPEDKWRWLVERGGANRIERDASHPQYWKIYVENPQRKFERKRVYEKRFDPNFKGKQWCLDWVVGERPGPLRFPDDRDRWRNLQHVVRWLECRGIEPLEADLTPKQRFLTDYDIKIKNDFRFGYFDIETDDTSGGFDNKEDNRILSIAWEGNHFDTDPSDAGFVRLEEDTDQAEREMLYRFKTECLDRYHVMVAWNGLEFDFPIVFWRFHERGFKYDWRYWLWVDSLPVFKRHYARAGGDATSFALDSIGEKVLGIRKIDWRPEFRRRHPGVTPTFRNLWEHDTELLERYNRHDCKILRNLEKETGFIFVEQNFCRIANGFPNDFQISTKIDQLLLKKGLADGMHFRTRYDIGERPDKYYGAYVFEPDVGFYKNVGAFDFKSLYPSMIRAFNISPETLIKEHQRDRFDPNDVCSIPLIDIPDETTGAVDHKGGTTFRTDKEGYISQMFVRTLERRKKYQILQNKRLEECGSTQDSKFLLYYRLAYSFKRLGLSFYGDLGNPRSRYYDVELAESITLAGQFFIKLTQNFAAEKGFKVLYGDTDSVYLQLMPDDTQWPSHEERIKTLVEVGNDFVAYCHDRYTKILKQQNCNLKWNVIELEFEDIYDSIFFVRKKRYAGRMLSKKGAATDDVEVKGLEVMRSDVSESARSLQKAILDAILMEGKTADEIENEIVRPEFQRCIDGQLAIDEVVIGKGISKHPEYYKNTTLHVRLADEIKRGGHEYFVGMKVAYVVTRAGGSKLEGVTREQYEEDELLTYDPEYYWDRVIYPPTLRILEVVFPDRPWKRLLVSDVARRAKLVARYKVWFLDKKRVAKALAQIKDKVAAGILGEEELAVLRKSPRVRIVQE